MLFQREVDMPGCLVLFSKRAEAQAARALEQGR